MILIGIGKIEERERIQNETLKAYRELIKKPPTPTMLSHYEDGKPYFKGAEDIKVSISHSGEYFVIGLSQSEIGLDIQENKEIDYKKISARYGIECSSINDFYRYFTLAEAQAKLDGEGLPHSLHRTSTIVGKTYRFIKGYTLSVVGSEEAVFITR